MTAQTTVDETTNAYSQQEYAAAFAVAKEALTYVASFQTPPTPDVYEIWYRFAEGSNSELTEQLSFAMNELKSVSRERIQQLHQEFFARADANERNADLSNDLASELGGLESMINTQLTISGEFDDVVSSVGQTLSEDASPDELRGCVETVLATSQVMHNQLRELRTQLEQSQEKVEKLREDFLESQKSLQTDPLTGVGNRRCFDTAIKQAIEERSTTDKARVLLLIDLDRFKEINDVFGHTAGDEVLRYVASKMQQVASEAQIARYGGDEFAVFMSCEDPQIGLRLANSLCEYFANNRLTMRKTGETLGHVGLSIGMALLRSDDTGESWFDRADKLLYSAKQSGRGRVMAERKLDLG
jgi:diguanylate cyclase